MLALLVCGVLFALVAGCGHEASNTTGPGPRVVSLSPAATVMLTDLGLGSMIVGRHGFDDVADGSLPVVGDQTGIDYERLLSVDPTHIVIEWGSRDPPARLVELSRSRGIELLPIDTLTLTDIAESGERLITTLGEHATPDRTRAFAGALAALSQRHEPVPEAGRVLLVVSTSPTVDCLGPGSAHHELLQLAGFTPAIESGAPWITLSLEDAIALNPDSLVLIQPGGSGEVGEALGPLGSAPIRAVELGRAVVITDPLALIPGSNLAGFGETLRARLLAVGPLPSPRE